MLVAKADRKVELEVRDGTADWMTFDQIFIDEDYDLRRVSRFDDVHRLYREMLANGDTPLILDLGANVGFSAAYFHLQWPEAKIVAVEPDADNLGQLQKNVSTLSAIDAVAGAISSQPGKVQIKDSGVDKNAFRIVASGTGNGAEVAAVTVPEIFERYAAERCRPFVVKIDIEGAEADLFSRNFDWVDDVPMLIVELHDWLYPGERTSRNFLSAIAGRDRDFVYLDENVFSIRNVRGEADAQLTIS